MKIRSNTEVIGSIKTTLEYYMKIISLGNNPTRKYRMDKKSFHIIPFMGKKIKWHICLGNFVERAVIKGYDILLRNNMKNPTDDADETKDGGVTATLKIFNNISYNRLILSQEDMVFFQILE